MMAPLGLLTLALCLRLTTAIIPTSRLDLLLPSKACLGQPRGRTVCWPYHFSQFVVCRQDEFGRSYGTVEWCESDMQCPVSIPFKEMSEIIGELGKPGNWSYAIPKQKGSITVFSPVAGQCQLGMRMEIASRGFPPRNQIGQEKTINVNWDTVISNDYNVYGSLPVFNGYYGDVVNFRWEEGDRLLAWWNNQKILRSTDRPLVVPWPPQPVYMCPYFNEIVNGTHEPIEGETIMHPHTSQGVVSVTMNNTGTWYLADAAPGACRLGLVFRVDVAEAEFSPREPDVYPVAWELTSYDNKPNLQVLRGDILIFHWQQLPMGETIPSPDRGVSILEPDLIGSFFFDKKKKKLQ